jgi:hypothetical protein
MLRGEMRLTGNTASVWGFVRTSLLFSKHRSIVYDLLERAECPELPKKVKIDGEEVRFSFSSLSLL